MVPENLTLTWHPETGGKRALIVFEDDKTYDVGRNSGDRFDDICKRMLNGKYYPNDAVVVNGEFQSEKRLIQVGDRIFQYAPLIGRFGGPKLRSVVEIFVAERSKTTTSYSEELNTGNKSKPRYCHFGYVTTENHHGRGIWQARLEAIDERLKLRVWSTSMPNSIWFWLGLPVARYLQLRARRRAIEEFRKI